MDPDLYLILTIAIIAVVTLLTRALPFLVFGKRELPPVIHDLGCMLPPAIMVILVCYCLKGIDLTAAPYGLPELIACAAVTVVHLLKKNMYLSILVGTVCYMVLIRIL